MCYKIEIKNSDEQAFEEKEAKKFIQKLSELAGDKHKKSPEQKLKFWSWILCNKDKAYDKFLEEKDSKQYSQRSLGDYAQELGQELGKLLTLWLLCPGTEIKVKVERDTIYIYEPNKSDKNDFEPVFKKKCLGVIVAARKIQKVLESESVTLFYKSQEWRNYIRERCGKLSVLGFSQDKYPLTEDFYVIPNFDNLKDHIVTDFKNLENNISEQQSRVVITGQSGIGKTSLLKYIAIHCYKQEICKGYVPMYISLRRASFLENQLPHQTPLDIYMSTLSDTGVKITREQVIEVFLEGKALILIDGLDINYFNSLQHINLIKELITKYPKNSFIISSKYLPPFLNDFDYIFSVRELDNNQSQLFFNNYFKFNKIKIFGSNSTKSNETNNDSFKISDEQQSYIPLVLCCLCYEKLQSSNNKSSATNEVSKLGNNTELINNVIRKLIDNWDYERGSDVSDPYYILSPKQRMNLLGFLAARCMEGVSKVGNQANVPAAKDDTLRWIIQFINTNEINNYYLQQFQILSLDAEVKIEHIAKTLLESIEFQDGLVVERNRGEISFIHGSIQKYLAAEYLSYSGLNELDQYLSLEGDWVEVVQEAVKMIQNKIRDIEQKATKIEKNKGYVRI